MTYDPGHLLKIVSRIMDQCAHPQAALRVWSVLQAHGGPQDVVEFERDQLADWSNVSLGTVSRAISELERMGALARETPKAHPSHRGRGPITVRMRRFW